MVSGGGGRVVFGARGKRWWVEGGWGWVGGWRKGVEEGGYRCVVLSEGGWKSIKVGGRWVEVVVR